MLSDTQKWLLLAAIIVFAVLLYLLGPVLTPFLVGAGLAYLGDPLADRLEAKGLPRTAAVIVVFSIMLAALASALVVLVPLLQQQVEVLIDNVPAYLDWLEREALPWLRRRVGFAELRFDLVSLKQALLTHWQQVGGVAADVLGSVTRSGLAIMTWLATVVLIPLVTFYLLRDWDVMIGRIGALVPRRHLPVVTRLVKECDAVLGGFLRGQLAVMVMLGAVYTLGLWLVGLDLALLIGLFAGLVSFVPYLGFILGVLFAGVAALMQFQELFPVLLVLLVFGVGQVLESFIFTPLLVGDRIGLHPVAVIFAVMAGGQLFGFVGVLLALPAAAVLVVLLRYAKERYLASRVYAGGDGV
ncbi:MAG: AI-2E family transporter [Pseudomonadota bacterium]